MTANANAPSVGVPLSTHRFSRGLVLLCSLAAACAAEPKNGTAKGGHPRDAIVAPAKLPLLVSVTGQLVQSGFARSKLSAQRDVPSFRITKHPITWAEFDSCTKAHACAKADASACSGSAYTPYGSYSMPDYAQHAETAPATCVGEEQAEAFCSWIGGSLPTLDEWLLAARGDAPKRFAWGDEVTSCNLHPLAPQVIEHQNAQRGPMPGSKDDPSCEVADLTSVPLAVGEHEEGSSPSGVEDVLLAPAELLGADRDGMFNACSADGSHCVVFGLDPGAIDSVEPFFTAAKDPSSTTAPARFVGHAYGFRCVLSQKSEAKR